MGDLIAMDVATFLNELRERYPRNYKAKTLVLFPGTTDYPIVVELSTLRGSRFKNGVGLRGQLLRTRIP